ncbi:MAG: tRNA uridine-5-carboxymethylaminomethyl(34) synthesis enzyme MnmG [Dehalococcoidia bacterium]
MNTVMIYDVIVVGAGHAGCEAALAAARMGCETLLLTMNLDNVALMPCNPSIGGPAKGHLVREIDALGGEMARNTDRTFIQIRMLNTGKGPAVRALRAQADKKLYGLTMKYTLERQPGLNIKQAMVVGLETVNRRDGRLGAVTDTGKMYEGRTVVITTGTSLSGRIIIGEQSFAAGRAGEFAAYGLSESLLGLGFKLGRLKTGTPPRLDARTIDFSRTIAQPGSEVPLYFSFSHPPEELNFPEANPVFPHASESAWRKQIPCYMIYTNEKTHEAIRSNIHRAPLYSGGIKGSGPRYCPSIEDKVMKFADKTSHPLFLEPEGWETNEVYLQGGNTSLPEDVQIEMVRTVPALEKVEIIRLGYAIEYDYVAPGQIRSTMETRLVPGLFLAGQINGTTGYEEAAGQGLVAGINAALKVKGKPELVFSREQGYIGVMVDDLVTKELTEPYRLFTSRAEYRLLLRHDNADLRLTETGYRVGLVDEERYRRVEAKRRAIPSEMARLGKSVLVPEKIGDVMKSHGMPALGRNTTALDFLRRPGIGYKDLRELGLGDSRLADDVADQVEIEAKYGGYIEKQELAVHRMRKLESRRIPQSFEYDSITGLRYEACFKLNAFRPQTLGQASRIDGVTPADMALLMVHLERARDKQGRPKPEAALPDQC